MKSFWQVVLLLLAGCTATSESSQGSKPSGAAPTPPLPRLYWALDPATHRSRTVLPGPTHYAVTVVTRCLNDSAVINRVLLDDGPALEVAHNYESELAITRQGQAWQQARLTKELFRQSPVVAKMGPLSELFLSHTAFLRYTAPGFHFTTRIGVPDSDIFAEAEVVLTPGAGLRIISVRENAGVSAKQE